MGEPTAMSTQEVVRRLNAALGVTLVAALAGNRARKISNEWQRADGPEPDAAEQARLQTALQIWTDVSGSEG